MLEIIYSQGPATEGIFRRCANKRHVAELRQLIDDGSLTALNDAPIIAVAALLKVLQ